jgi:hypothetical protein
MLHIVQVVFAGVSDTPQVFLDQAKAESAFVEQVKKTWKQSYPVHCEASGVEIDAIASAKSFLETLDLSEKSRINYWVVGPEDADLAGMLRELAEFRQRQENVGKLVRQVDQKSSAIRDRLTGLLDDIAKLSGHFEDTGASPNEIPGGWPGLPGGLPFAAGPAFGSTPTPAPASTPTPASVPAKCVEEGECAEIYTTKEWKNFVGMIMNTSGGNRSEFSLLPRTDWRQAVYSDETHLEYWDWAAEMIHKYKEVAAKAGYAVVEDQDSPGHYRFRIPEGTVDETSFYSEWEAWCYAGMQLAQ